MPAKAAYALYCDDSGGEDDALRSAACVSGPARVLLALERELRQVLRIAGMRELKWSALRTRAARLQAARAFIELAALGAGAGALRVEVLLWRPRDQGRASRARSEAQRLRPVYARLWRGAARAWPAGRWNVHPDQRTGMRWQELGPVLKGDFGRDGGRLRALKEASSARSACVQLADLLAGLCRVPARPDKDSPAWRNRAALRAHLAAACAQRGLRLGEREGLFEARQSRLSITQLRRLPARA